MKPLTQRELDQAHCSTPGCTHAQHGGLYLHGQCHPDAAVDVYYLEGLLHVRCAVCKLGIVAILVAEEDP